MTDQHKYLTGYFFKKKKKQNSITMMSNDLTQPSLELTSWLQVKGLWQVTDQSHY